jgi:hypothetical protein
MIFRATARYGVSKAFPVGLSKTLRNDQIQVLPQDFVAAVTENLGGRVIPDRNRSLKINRDDGIGCLIDCKSIQHIAGIIVVAAHDSLAIAVAPTSMGN